ncbi:RNA-binding protein [Trypanosoma conorhini]|uniref:RNA-binding protein n=1 Tax=Trypanosoma conorhini TaxID=83891 RepID=A0A3R7NY25_9TRYP|nr:RNA-binding protein [Trypanosoma conorhini]RNF25615.1 RNA-binding protein [Trypanosoma conorhini]
MALSSEHKGQMQHLQQQLGCISMPPEGLDEMDSNPLSASAVMPGTGTWAAASVSTEPGFFFSADAFAEKLFMDDENSVSSKEDNATAALCKKLGGAGKGTVARDPHSDNQSRTNLFISNLPHKMEQHELEKLFSPYGQILSAAVMRNIHTGHSLGTAFVRYAATEEATRAIEAMSGKRVSGRAIIVQWARKQHDDAPVGEARKKICKLFVRNIPLDISATDLEKMFSPYGPVKAVSIHKDTTPDTDKRFERHIAFITYLVDGAAVRAAEAVHNTRPFPTCGKVPLMVKLAEDTPQHNHHGAGRSSSGSSVNNTFKGNKLLRRGPGRACPGHDPGYKAAATRGCFPVGADTRGFAVAPGSFVPVMTPGGLMLPASVPGAAVVGGEPIYPWGTQMIWPQAAGVPLAFYGAGAAATPANPLTVGHTPRTVSSPPPVVCMNNEGFTSIPAFAALFCPATPECFSEARVGGMGGSSAVAGAGFSFS